MKVGIDTGPLISGHKVRGIGVHTRELIEGFKEIKSKGLQIEPVDFSKTNLKKYDIVHYQNFYPYFLTLPSLKPSKKVVVTIHDLIQLIYKKQYPPGLKGWYKFMLQKKRIKNVDAILTISETSKKDICRFLPVHPDKVHVVHLAPRKIFKKLRTEELKKIKTKYKLPSKFILYVGDVNYNKNILTLIKACKRAGVVLVICGKQALDIEDLGMGLDVLAGPQDWLRFLFDISHPELTHYSYLRDGFKDKAKVIRLGFVPDEDLVAIYNLATVYCQPSFYEGFGLPILEAFSSGTPVVASKIQAHVEVAEDAVVYFDPKSAPDLTRKIKEIMKSSKRRKVLVKKGLARVKKYSWGLTVRQTARVYEKVFKQ